jgi:hypothetical protein
MANGRVDMTEANEPDKKNNETEITKDEVILELEEEAAEGPKDDEEPIDLVDVAEESPVEKQDDGVEIGEQAPIEGTKGDEEIIDLLEVEAAEEQKPAEDEPIIELIEEATEETKGDEEIADLIEAAEQINNIEEPVSDAADTSQEFDDIDEFDNNLIEETDDFTDELDTAAMMDEAMEDDIADSLGIELDSDEDISGDYFEADKITDEKIDAALERVIKKMFYEKIDRLLIQAIEKTVKMEIERLKKALLEDSPDGEK